MSWDVMIMRFDGRRPLRMEDWPEGFQPPSLGPANEVRRLISAIFTDVDWSEPNWGRSEQDGHTIEFSIGADDPVEALMLHVHGGGDPVAAICRLCAAYHWEAMDCSSGEWLDLARPNSGSWKQFQAFRDSLLDLADQAPDEPTG
ncbi:MAG: hypothetical protein ACHRHE_19225 [Tepidisphaerales bacterium]